MGIVQVEKDADRELPVPIGWRPALKQIADAFALGKVPEAKTIKPVEPQLVRSNFKFIREYPVALGPLADRSWDTSVFVWADDHWEVLVDLSSEDGSRSDLVLHADIYEGAEGFEIEPGMIYVP
jgi:hypothetical protein